MSTSTKPTQPVQQQQPRVQKPPFADWPTIKILTPPQGRFSRKRDEWCFTYCSQSISGRIYGKDPSCRSVCMRKIFPHEVKNIMTFKAHKSVGSDGKAKYSLPAEGQPTNLPRLLGGRPFVEEEEENDPDSSDKPKKVLPTTPRKPSQEEMQYWQEGWYFWTSNNRWAIHEKTDTMLMDLEQQQRMSVQKEQRKELWQDYQDHLTKGSTEQVDQSKWWGPIVPLRPPPDHTAQSMLVPLPPNWPSLWERIGKLLAPTQKVLSIFHESITSGEQLHFTQRVWQKAWTDEPFILASRTLSRAYERWKERDATDEDDGKTGPA